MCYPFQTSWFPSLQDYGVLLIVYSEMPNPAQSPYDADLYKTFPTSVRFSKKTLNPLQKLEKRRNMVPTSDYPASILSTPASQPHSPAAAAQQCRAPKAEHTINCLAGIAVNVAEHWLPQDASC